MLQCPRPHRAVGFGVRPISPSRHHERLIEQAACIQVGQERRQGLVEGRQQVVLHVVAVDVRIPAVAVARVVNWTVTNHAGLHQPAGDQGGLTEQVPRRADVADTPRHRQGPDQLLDALLPGRDTGNDGELRSRPRRAVRDVLVPAAAAARGSRPAAGLQEVRPARCPRQLGRLAGVRGHAAGARRRRRDRRGDLLGRRCGEQARPRPRPGRAGGIFHVSANVAFYPQTTIGVNTYAASDTVTPQLYYWGAQYVQSNWAGPYVQTLATAINNGPIRQIVPQAQNLILQSQTFDNASWTKAACTITAAAITAPDGTLTGEALVASTLTNTNRQLTQPETALVLKGMVATYSVYAKAGAVSWILLACDGSANAISYYNLSGAGATGNTAGNCFPSIQNIGNGWYRCILTVSPRAFTSGFCYIEPASANGVVVYTAGDTSSAANLCLGSSICTIQSTWIIYNHHDNSYQ